MLSLEEKKRLAEICNPGRKIIPEDGDVVVLLDGTDYIYWNPDLTGPDWQKAQALDVIVAALNPDAGVEYLFLSRKPNVYRFSIIIKKNNGDGEYSFNSDDLLTACSRALLRAQS